MKTIWSIAWRDTKEQVLGERREEGQTEKIQGEKSQREERPTSPFTLTLTFSPPLTYTFQDNLLLPLAAAAYLDSPQPIDPSHIR